MKRVILGLIGFVFLVENFTTFLVLLIPIAEINAGSLNEELFVHGFSEPQMTGADLKMLWAFVGSVVIADIALTLVYADIALFRSRYIKTELLICGTHFLLILIWISLAVTIYSQQQSQGHVYFSEFINHLRPQLFFGGAASCLAFIVLLDSKEMRGKGDVPFID